jgi:hypothetical protein
MHELLLQEQEQPAQVPPLPLQQQQRVLSEQESPAAVQLAGVLNSLSPQQLWKHAATLGSRRHLFCIGCSNTSTGEKETRSGEGVAGEVTDSGLTRNVRVQVPACSPISSTGAADLLSHVCVAIQML